MDDNKVLTLANNDRIPLHPWMRLLFEIGNLKHATPATVSRAGILFLNEVRPQSCLRVLAAH
jgi:dynein heavy chain